MIVIPTGAVLDMATQVTVRLSRITASKLPPPPHKRTSAETCLIILI